MSDKKSALVLGATGAVGKHLLRDLLASPHFDRVGEFGRRVTEKEKLEGTDISKLVQKKIDFEKLTESDQGLKEGKWDVVFIT
jgi:oxidoreductase